MIDQRRVLALVPARGGSKGVPRKNLRLLAGRSLIAWSFEHARQSNYVDRIILSSEDTEIISVAAQLGFDVPFRRPAELASDTASGMDTVLHALNEVADGDIIVLLQPTSPLRSAADVDACIEVAASRAATSCVSVTSVKHPPEYTYVAADDGTLHAFSDVQVPTRRQDLRNYVALNGAVYAASREALLKNRTFLVQGAVGHLMPYERSIDIDTEFDFQLAQWLIEKEPERKSL